MVLNLDTKKQIVSEVAAVASDAPSAIAAYYHGLNVAAMTDLRRRARQHGVYLRVVKNTLARRALENTSFECMRDGLSGPLILAFSRDDPTSVARLFKEFSDEQAGVEVVVKMVALDGELLDVSEVKRLATLPTYDRAVAMLMGVMQAPVAKFARTLAEVPSKFARVLAAVRDQKQAGA